MRKRTSLDALFPKTRQMVLATTLIDPSREWYLSDLARHLKLQPSSLQRELASLVEAGILRRRIDGNRSYYSAEPDCPILGDLQGLLVKTAGLKDVLVHCLKPFQSVIEVAFVYGSIARKTEHATSDIDLMVVGSLGLSDIAPLLTEAESRLLRPINPTIYQPEAFATKLGMGHHFLNTVMNGEKLFVLGNEDDLEATLKREKRSGAHDEPAGA